MNIHKRFKIHFFGQLGLTVFLLLAMTVTVFATIGFVVMEEEVTQDLTEANGLFLTSNLELDGEKLTIKEELKTLVENQNGWLIAYRQDGSFLDSYHVPSDLNDRKNLKVESILKESGETTYQHWNLELKEAQRIQLLFGKRNIGQVLMNELKQEVDWGSGKLSPSRNTMQKIKRENGWVQLLDPSGEVVDDLESNGEPKSYSTAELISLKGEDTSVSTYLDENSGQILLAGSHEASSSGASTLRSFSNGGIILLLILIAVLLLGPFWHARKYGLPLITMMKWIQNLSNGVYEQPLDSNGRPVMKNTKGKLKRKYRLYKDLITNLSQLTETLHQNTLYQKQMAATREEWISGLSHDLKTPLASISGYAHMLEAETYGWTKEETRQFAGIITEKSTYMEQLIEELTLTYRLKNRALPINKEETDMNELLRRTLIHFINDQANRHMTFQFAPYESSLYAKVDPKWFQRVLDNLIANAIKYNAPGTEINLSLSKIEQHLVVITIEDNGRGMNKETMDRLFQRYYRGTNTSETSTGSGLGMAITKQLIELHNGSINVSSTVGIGTKVRIMVPV
ncbi:HAMP domain-containing histidine kinase [Bacillus haikouensis]|nr:HAMP domain-containing histidine kinase [Bacillus haikouensis]